MIASFKFLQLNKTNIHLRFLASPTLSAAFFSADNNCWIPAEGLVIVKDTKDEQLNQNKSTDSRQTELSEWANHMTRSVGVKMTLVESFACAQKGVARSACIVQVLKIKHGRKFQDKRKFMFYILTLRQNWSKIFSMQS